MRIVSFPAASQKLDFRHEIEMTFQCPSCFTIETLFLEEGAITQTPHWTQVKGKIYHRDCRRPARLINMSRRVETLPSGTAILLARFIQRRQITLGQLAHGIGVSRITVKRWMYGRTSPNRASKERIAGYLGVPLNEIFPQENG